MGLRLEQLADEVGVHERTLRRAAGSGLLHARRSGPRRLSLSDSETVWVRSHWPLVGRLRAVLRTEPNVALAVLFGSVARGDDLPDSSDVDLLVELRISKPGALQALQERLTERLGVEVQIVPLQVTRRDPLLMEEILRDGRPLIDRDRIWSEVQAQRGQIREQAAVTQRTLRDEAHSAIDYFRQLAAQRGPSTGVTGQ